MIHSIPNLKKQIQFSKPIGKVLYACQHLQYLYPKYRLWKYNELANQVIYETTEFLSVGVFMDISLISKNQDFTLVEIEIRRKIGTFNQPHEVTYANQHIQKITTLISEAMDKDESYFLEYQNHQIELQKENIGAEKRTALYVFIIGIILFILIIILNR